MDKGLDAPTPPEAESPEAESSADTSFGTGTEVPGTSKS